MRDGFIKVAAGTPQIRVADCRYNAEQIFTLMREADKQGVRVLALPELCLTGYTCGDLFLQDTLLRGAEEGLATILEATKHLDLLAAVGLPVRHQNKLYNCAAVLHRGEILALVPKTYLPNYGEFYEKRWFEPAGPGDRLFSFCGQEVYLGSDVIFPCESMPGLTVGVEICEDLWASTPPLWPWPRRGPPLSSTCPPPTSWWARPSIAAAWCAASPPGWCAAMSTPRRGGGVHHRSGLQRPQHRGRERRPAGRAPLRHRAHRVRGGRGAAGLRAPPPDHLPLQCGQPGDHRPLRPGAVHHHPHPPCQPPALRPRGRRRVQRTLRRDHPPGGAGPQKAHGAQRRTGGGGGPVRRVGLHPGHPHHQRGHAHDGPAGQRHDCRHHALLRHHRAHPGQRRGAGRAAGGHPQAHRHWRGGSAALQGHWPVHGRPRCDL